MSAIGHSGRVVPMLPYVTIGYLKHLRRAQGALEHAFRREADGWRSRRVIEGCTATLHL